MVHVSNGEGHRKMLALSRPQPPQTTSPASNLNHIILTNTITKSCLKDPSSSPTTSYLIETNGTSLPISAIPGSVVGPLPSYKSNSLNLSCIVEEEPPPGMMMSQIREVSSVSQEQDNNANVSLSITSPDSNLNPGSTNLSVVTTTERIQENRVFTEEVLVSPSGKTKKRTTTSESRVEKVSTSIGKEQHESPGAGKLKSPARAQQELLISQGLEENANVTKSSPTNGNTANANTSSNIPNSNVNENQTTVVGTPKKDSPPHSAVRHPKLANGTQKTTGLKRVSFGSSKGSMVETLIFESPVSDERRDIVKAASASTSSAEPTSPVQTRTEANEAVDSPGAASSGDSTGGSRPPSRVRVTFFESEKPLAVSSPESDNYDFDYNNMTLPGSPNAVDGTNISYNRQMSTESGWDNPFRPDGDLSKEADQIVELIKEGKPINDETLRSKSPSVNEMMSSTAYSNILNASPPGKGANGVNGGGMEVQRGVVVPPSQAGQVEHVTLKKKKGCCVIQ